MYDDVTKGYIMARFKELPYKERCPIVLGYNRYAEKRGYNDWREALLTLVERHCREHRETLNDLLNRVERTPQVLLGILEANEFPCATGRTFKFSLSPDGVGGNS